MAHLVKANHINMTGDKSIRCVNIKLSTLEIISYWYIAIPVLIFTATWLRPIVAVIASVCIIVGILFTIQQCLKNKDVVKIPAIMCFVIILIAILWVCISGVGGLYPQRADWHWRNALLHDLIEYSWPVIYPETNEGLVYYLTYFLLPAVVGKAFGWTAANAVLILWSAIGISLAFFLLINYLKPDTVKKIIVVLMIFIVWREFDDIRLEFCRIFDANWGYQFTSNDGLLQWVTNQTVVPWVVTLLLINDRNIRNYIFMGLLLFASAPFPFVGLFIFLVSDGLYQLKRYNNVKKWMRDVFSKQNILSIISIFPVFGLYYLSNSAASGDAGHGGLGLFVGTTRGDIMSLILFLIFNSLAFAILIFKDYKNRFLFYITVISLLLIPFIRVGESGDFCWRASIPALIFMMIYVIQYLFTHYKEDLTVSFYIIVGSIGLFVNSFAVDTLSRTSEVVHAKNRAAYQAEGIGSFAIRLPYTDTYGLPLNNFLTNKTYKKRFYRFLAKNKSNVEMLEDSKRTEKFLNEKNFVLISGKYTIYPLNYPDKYLNKYTVLSDTTIDGKYEIYLSENGTRLIVKDSGLSNKKSVDSGGVNAQFATNDKPENQLFSIEKENNCYKIIWKDNYALTHEADGNYFEPIDDSKEQLWNIENQ